MHSASNLAALFVSILCSSSAFAAPLLKREVPQGELSFIVVHDELKLTSNQSSSEHSHEQFLTSVRASLALNNPAGIKDPVFGLLGSAAAAAGQGTITDTDCLHLATADQAFTNAKAAGDTTGMVDALIYAALERNTGKVGLASALCTSVKAVNPEVAAISQHQVLSLHSLSRVFRSAPDNEIFGFVGSCQHGRCGDKQGHHTRAGPTDRIGWRRPSAGAQGRHVRAR